MSTGLSTPIAITTASGRPDEERVRAHLLDLFDRYSLDRWRYTEEARIEAGVIPHSHPLLTLNTQYGDDPAHLLADYIHEQLHWFTLLADSPHATGEAIMALDAAFPDLPTALPEGCGSPFSNRLHLLICYLEFDGVWGLIGEEGARALLRSKRYYTRVYDLVLRESARFAGIIAVHSAFPPDLPPATKAFRQVE